MRPNLKIGLIGLDTSHVVAFTNLLNNAKDPYHVAGAPVVAAFPGGSADFELSYSRVEGYTDQLRNEFAVEILDSPEAVCEKVDLVFITAVDGRAHRELFEKTASFKRPTFIDKPFATKKADAEAILSRGRELGVTVMSTSSLRYAENFVEALSAVSADKLVGIDVFGPMQIEPTQPGLFWYGIHSVEMVVAAMGPGVRCVRAVKNEGVDLITAEWHDGRIASVRGLRKGHQGFGVTLHGNDGCRFVEPFSSPKPPYASLLDAIIRSLPKGRSDVPAEEMLEVVHFIEAANESRENGTVVKL